MALSRRGVARGSGRVDPLDLHPRPLAPGRAPQAHSDAGLRLLARSNRFAHVRVWIPGRSGDAPLALALRPALDGHPVGSGDGHLHPAESVRNRLRVLRAELDWSQADLAARLGVSRQTVNAIATGTHDPSLPLAFTIAPTFTRRIA